MANETGTGRHPHKSAEEPYPHTRESGTEHGKKQGHESGGKEHRAQGGSESHGRGQEDASLKEREYRDSQGEVRHHTKTYMEQHEKK